MAVTRPDHALRIGDCRFDPASNELQREGAVQRLPARLADLLLRLAQQPGQTVRRETLIDEVWERRLVNDEVLSRAIADLRQALGDDARAPRCIETLPKLGYRLVAPVEAWVEAGAEPAASPGDAPAAARADVLRDSPASATARAPRALPWIALLAAGLAAFGAWHAVAPPSLPLPPPSAGIDAARLLGARPFIAAPGRELFPRFTPDARWVVYTRAPDEAPASLRLRAVDGTEDRVLVEDALDNWCGVVSPDGATLAWLRRRPGVCELMQRPLLGGPARVLAGCDDMGTLAGCPEWTPDGRGLLLGAGRTQRGLRAISFPDGTERAFEAPPPGQADLQPRIARDGRHITFWRGDGGGRGLWQVPFEGGAAQPLRAAPFLAFGHAYDRDAALVAADDRFGQRALVRLAAQAEPVLLGAADARHPDIARNGALIYEVARYDANLWRIALDEPEAPPQRLTASARYDSQPRHAPDGTTIAFGSNRDGREAIYLVAATGGEERKLPLDPALRWTSPLWSPDGSALFVQRYDAQGARLCRHELATGRTDCPDALRGERHGAFHLDEAHLGLVDASGTPPRLWRVALDGSDAQPVDTQGPVERCRATARWLACQRPGVAGLWVQERASGAATVHATQFPADAGAAWTLHQDALWFSLATGEAPGIHRHDLLTSRSERVHPLFASAIGDALSVAPDGHQVVLARTDSVEIDLMYLPPP